MQKLLLIAATLCAVLCVGDSTLAFDVKNKFMISGHGGLAIPAGDFGDGEGSNPDAKGAKPGFAIGVSIEYGFTEQFLVGGRFAYARFGIDDDRLRDEWIPTQDLEGHWTVLEVIGLYGKYLVPTRTSTRPYGRAGLFLGEPGVNVATHDGDWSPDFDLSPGFDLALGVTHMVSPRCGLGLEARFAHLSTSEFDESLEAAPATRSAGVFGQTGIRDPGGNLTWLEVNAVVSYGF